MKKDFSRHDYCTDPRQNPLRKTLCDHIILKGGPDYFQQSNTYSNYQLERLAICQYDYKKDETTNN